MKFSRGMSSASEAKPPSSEQRRGHKTRPGRRAKETAMSFGFGGSPSPFGQQQQQQASPFGGGATPSFGGGAAPNAFGAAAGGAFVGGSQPGAFGAGAGGFGTAGQQRPAFGSASSSPAFGSGGFGTSAPSPTSSKRLSADLTSLPIPFLETPFWQEGPRRRPEVSARPARSVPARPRLAASAGAPSVGTPRTLAHSGVGAVLSVAPRVEPRASRERGKQKKRRIPREISARHPAAAFSKAAALRRPRWSKRLEPTLVCLRCPV